MGWIEAEVEVKEPPKNQKSAFSEDFRNFGKSKSSLSDETLVVILIEKQSQIYSSKVGASSGRSEEGKEIQVQKIDNFFATFFSLRFSFVEFLLIKDAT